METKFTKIVNREMKQAEMLLYGIIGDDWENGEIDGNYFARELNWLGKEFDEITIRINSWGGDLGHGLSIVSEIRASKAHITTRIDGVAASMSGVIAIAGDRNQMNDYARLMLHLAYYIDPQGNKVDNMSLRDQKALDQMNGILTDILSRKGKSKEDIQQILEDETWYNAEEAMAEGFIDQVIDTSKKSLAALEPKKLVALQMDEFDIQDNNSKPEKSMKLIAAKFGLSEDATEDQILAKIRENEKAATDEKVETLITVAKAMGTVSDELKNEEKARRVAKADVELFTELFLTPENKGGEEEEEELKDSKKTLIKDMVKKGKAKGGEDNDKKFEDFTEEELDEIRANDRKKYVALYEGRYGYEPEIED